jgi:transcriptional regulator with XRE-family HTH domain
MDIKDRIKQLMDYEQMNAGTFAERIGVAAATMSHTLGDRNKYPSTDFIMKLHESFPYISLDWLLLGTGDMIDTANSPESEENLPAWAEDEKNRKEIALETGQNAGKEIVRQEVIYKEKAARKITEIRIFFDDNTYEIFKPEK